jgi:hypothetical protein
MISKEEAEKLAEIWNDKGSAATCMVKTWQSAGLVEPDKKSKLAEARAGMANYSCSDLIVSDLGKLYESVIKQYQEIAEDAIRHIYHPDTIHKSAIDLLKQITENK